MTITIYHNPKCGTSRNTLAMIEQSGAMLDVIDYQKTPIGRAKLVEVIAATGLSVRDILRQRGTPYDELDLGNEKWSDDELIDFIVEHPILMNRPIVVSPKGAVLARPSEKVLDILPNPDIGSFTKEDGDVVK
ncbi:MAG: arsenate reductase (glutaredoxin) [Hyphomicrobiales bacterium]